MNNKSTLLGSILISTALNTVAEDKVNKDRPNILFCIADDALFHHFSANGCEWLHTPHFDRVAKQGILFRNCYTPNAKSAPSRAIVLTGRHSWQLEEAGNHICNFPEDLPVVTEVLGENGYQIGFTGKGWGPGNPGMKNGEKRLLTGKPYQRFKCKPLTSKSSNIDYAANFEDFVKKQSDTPWFFWYGGTDPHRPYEYGSGIKKGKKKLTSIPTVPPFWEDNKTTRTEMLDYGYELENYDRHLGRMIKTLEKFGQLENTIIVVTSDNGMPFPRCKANSYEYSTHMPLAIMWPKGIKNPGRETSQFVSFIDFAPTFVDVAGLNVKECGMLPFTGVSLNSIFREEQSRKEQKDREFIILGRERHDYGRPNNQGYPVRAIIKDSMLLIWNLKSHLYPSGNPETGYMDCDGGAIKSEILANNRIDKNKNLWDLTFGLRPEFELYNLKQDNFCVENLATQEQNQKLLKTMHKQLIKELRDQNDPRMGKGEILFDTYPFERAGWNFYEEFMNGKIKNPWEKTGWISPTDYETHPTNKK